MVDQENRWLIPLMSSMFLLIISTTLLETAAWFLQYGVLGLGMVLAVFSFYLAVLEESDE